MVVFGSPFAEVDKLAAFAAEGPLWEGSVHNDFLVACRAANGKRFNGHNCLDERFAKMILEVDACGEKCAQSADR